MQFFFLLKSPEDEIVEDMFESDRLPNNVMKVPEVYSLYCQSSYREGKRGEGRERRRWRRGGRGKGERREGEEGGGGGEERRGGRGKGERMGRGRRKRGEEERMGRGGEGEEGKGKVVREEGLGEEGEGVYIHCVVTMSLCLCSDVNKS